ncbi:DUF3376 domain-containing protein [Agromyces agglutinans]|nr:DUF3376 domain-containing protein [Agromyces agglutinans]
MPHADDPRSDRPIAVRPVGPGVRLADLERDGARPASGRTLRIALAMRGGVSLAVWIGGVAAELDLLRRIRLYEIDGRTTAVLLHPGEAPPGEAVQARAGAYAHRLHAAGYDRVEVDLLAGASAGGLNAVVYSVAQRAGTTLDDLLHTWGTVGGFWGLLHGPGVWAPRALMRGEGYFRPSVRDALVKLYGSTDGHPDLVPDYVSVDLSTTIIDAADQLEEDTVDGRGHFHFVGSDRHHLDNLVPRRGALDYPEKAADDLAQLDQLALAARSTSSLAGGFEPAEIRSTEWPAMGDLADPDDPGHLPDAAERRAAEASARSVAERADLRFAFAAHRARPAEPFRVIDGAVFDNVPIDRALRSAKLRASDRLADRMLVFLDPEPDPAMGGPAPWDPDATRFFSAVGAMFSKSMRRESVAREASELARFNGQRSIEATRRLAGAGLVASASSEPSAVADRDAAYVRALGGVVAEHLAEVLAQPSLWQLHSAGRRRRRYTPVDRSALAALDEAANARFARLAAERPDAALASPPALADAAACVLAWAREIESVPERPGSRRARELVAVRREAYAALHDADGSVDRVTEGVLMHVLRTCAPNRRPDAADLDAWLETWLAGCEAVDTAANWRALDACVAELTELTRSLEPEIAAHDHAIAERWRRSPWRAIGLAGPRRAVELAPLAYPIGIPASLSKVDYWAIGVDERPAAQGGFSELLADRFLTRVQVALRTPRRSVDEVVADLNAPDPDPIDRQTKLAGYGFGNFLGFLAKGWRVNDWWWGRLDGAAGLVRLLDSRAPGGDDGAHDAAALHDGAHDAASLDADVRLVQDAVLAESDEGEYHEHELSLLTPADEAPGEPPRARVRAGTDTLWNLVPGYRFALASRAIRLIDRAAAPANRILAGAVQALLVFLRPALVAVPAIADPPRLALVAGLTAGTAWLLTWTAFTPTTGSVVTAAVVVAAVGGGLAAGVIRSRIRWRRVRDGIADVDRRADVEAARRSSVPGMLKYALVAACSLVPLAIAIAWANVLMGLLCLGVSAALTSVAVRAASGARPTTVTARLVRTNLMVAAFVVLGGLLPVVQAFVASNPSAPGWAQALLEPPLPRDLPVLAVGAALVTIALTADWLPMRFAAPARASSRWVSWLTVTVIAVAGAWLVAWVVESMMSAIGLTWLQATSTAVAVFIVAWANGVWWLPEFRRDELPRDDRVERRTPRRVTGESGRS